jgi:hypothetical protein
MMMGVSNSGSNGGAVFNKGSSVSTFARFETCQVARIETHSCTPGPSGWVALSGRGAPNPELFHGRRDKVPSTQPLPEGEAAITTIEQRSVTAPIQKWCVHQPLLQAHR